MSIAKGAMTGLQLCRVGGAVNVIETEGEVDSFLVSYGNSCDPFRSMQVLRLCIMQENEAHWAPCKQY